MIIEEINLIQNINLKLLIIPIINDTLNLNISLIDNYLVINSTNIKSINEYQDIYNKLMQVFISNK